VERLNQPWRTLDDGATLMTLVLGCERFVGGLLVRQPPGELTRSA
jgi:hypothetical protein